MAVNKISMAINYRKNKSTRLSSGGKYYAEVDRQKTLITLEDFRNPNGSSAPESGSQNQGGSGNEGGNTGGNEGGNTGGNTGGTTGGEEGGM